MAEFERSLEEFLERSFGWPEKHSKQFTSVLVAMLEEKREELEIS